jgi:hypothetical protein
MYHSLQTDVNGVDILTIEAFIDSAVETIEAEPVLTDQTGFAV